MKILQFTLPVPDNKTIVTKEESLSYFYPHLHRHNEVQITWVMQGEGTLVTDNTMHTFKHNEVYWIGANQPHVFKSDPSYFEARSRKRTHTLDIFFDADTQLAAFFSIPEAKQLRSFIHKHHNGFRVPKKNTKSITDKIMLIRNSNGIDRFIHFIELLKQLTGIKKLEPLSTQANNNTYSDSEGIKIATIYNYIMQNYQHSISLEEIAKLAYMTPQAFCRYFKKHTNYTLIAFINQVRVNEACKKLVDKSYESIAAVAYNTGFNSITNFNRVFKSYIKKSPKEYLDTYYNNINRSSTDF